MTVKLAEGVVEVVHWWTYRGIVQASSLFALQESEHVTTIGAPRHRRRINFESMYVGGFPGSTEPSWKRVCTSCQYVVHTYLFAVGI